MDRAASGWPAGSASKSGQSGPQYPARWQDRRERIIGTHPSLSTAHYFGGSSTLRTFLGAVPVEGPQKECLGRARAPAGEDAGAN
jgi:hypothetical protein